jgi:hypothetical protein
MLGTIKEYDEFQSELDVRQITIEMIDRFNTVVHADPQGLDTNIGIPTAGNPGYLSGADLSDPHRCDLICQIATIYMTLLLKRAIEVFPDFGSLSGSVH